MEVPEELHQISSDTSTVHGSGRNGNENRIKRIQIKKGWIDVIGGRPKEKIYDEIQMFYPESWKSILFIRARVLINKGLGPY